MYNYLYKVVYDDGGVVKYNMSFHTETLAKKDFSDIMKMVGHTGGSVLISRGDGSWRVVSFHGVRDVVITPIE